MLDPTSRTLKQEIKILMDLNGFSLLKKSWLLDSILSLQSKNSNLYHSPTDHMQHQVLVATKSTQEEPVPAIPPAGGASGRELQPFLPGLVSNRAGGAGNCPLGFTA